VPKFDPPLNRERRTRPGFHAARTPRYGGGSVKANRLRKGLDSRETLELGPTSSRKNGENGA
jgi:hypothetical protein